MSSLNGGLTGAASFVQTQTSGPFLGLALPIPAVRLQSTFRSGTAVDQIDGLSFVLLTLAASTPQTVDLLALTDAFGATLTVARVAFVAIKILSGADGSILKVGAAGANEFDGLASSGATVNVYPPSPGNDGFAVFSAPNATAMPVDSTHHLLKFDPGTAALTVQVLIGTRSA